MAEKRPDRTLGAHHDTFWDYCGKGELRVQKCASCGHLHFPVVRKCEGCGHVEMTWQSLSGRGKVVSWGSFHQDYYHKSMPIPYDCLLVELEEGPLFISNPSGFGCDDLTPDMAVKVAFIDCEDSAGPFSLPVFERV